MDTKAAYEKEDIATRDEAAQQAYHRYVPGARLGWAHLTMEERLAWQNVARAMPPREQRPEPERPWTLGQICFEAAGAAQPESRWPPVVGEGNQWEAAAQAVAVAGLQMRSDAFSPESPAATEG